MARCLILPSALHIILLALLSMYHATPGQSLSCGDPHTVAQYRVRFQGLWTKSRFPKVYPVNRPKAEWSSLVGRTHSTGYSLFRMGETASNKLKTFAEYGDVTPLASEGQGSSTIFDAFTTPPLPSGYGTSEAQLFAESGKDKVSLVVKIVPSPDWFVGVDSLDLCTDGEWVDLHETDLWPLDAGTQQVGIYVRPGFQVSFRGFLISVFDKATNLPVGRMRQTTQFVMASIPSNITTKLVCDNTSLTHWTADDKKIIFFEWEAPWTFTEDNDLEIRLTIVQERETFWKDCNSVWFPMKLQNAPPTTTTFAPPTTTTAFPDITEQLTTLAATTRAPLTRTTSRNLLKLRFGFAGR